MVLASAVKVPAGAVNLNVTELVSQGDGSTLIWCEVHDSTGKVIHYVGLHSHLAHNCAPEDTPKACTQTPCAVCQSGLATFAQSIDFKALANV